MLCPHIRILFPFATTVASISTMPPTNRAARIAEADWEKHRAMIEHYYLSCNMELRTVVETMQKKSNFCATDKQYKRQFARWGLRKNITSKEMYAVLENPAGNAVVRGIKVSKTKFNRYVRRYRLNRTDGQADDQERETAVTAPDLASSKMANPGPSTQSAYVLNNTSLTFFESMRRFTILRKVRCIVLCYYSSG